MNVDLEKLERLIKAARPLPWHKQSFEVYGWKNKRRVFIAQTSKPIMRGIENIVQRLNDADYIVAACNAVPELIKRIKELERQKEEAVRYILSNEGASMIDCRMCFFVSSCECGPTQCNPDYEMCKRAVRKAIEEAGE